VVSRREAVEESRVGLAFFCNRRECADDLASVQEQKKEKRRPGLSPFHVSQEISSFNRASQVQVSFSTRYVCRRNLSSNSVPSTPFVRKNKLLSIAVVQTFVSSARIGDGGVRAHET